MKAYKGKLACGEVAFGTNVTAALMVQLQALFLAILPLCHLISAFGHLNY